MKVRFLGSALALVSMCGCNLPSSSDIRLGVPYRAQEQYNYCAPACVLMWRLYDSLAPISQTSIYNWMGGFPGCATPARTADAVRNFTTTYDAYADGDYPSNYKNMLARQITSIDQGTPVIAVINYDHTVVLQGGKWHPEGPNNMWEYVYYHDPDPWVGRDQLRAASVWIQEFCPPAGGFNCFQIISQYASRMWETNYINYSASLSVYGEEQTENQY